MRLIDADVLIEEALTEGVCGYIDALQIAMTPTVDVIEVVRFQECKHYKPQKKSAHWENSANYCNRVVTIKVQPYDFCSRGELKDNEEASE